MEEEYLDIVDEKDNVIGKDTRKNIYLGDKPKHLIRYVHVLVFNSKGELLVPKRSLNREIFPGCYDFSCSEHVSSGETYKEAAIRGLEEELGIKNVKLQEVAKLSPKEGVHGFTMTYEIRYNGSISNYDRDGISSLHWFNIETIKKMIVQNKKQFKSDFPVVFQCYLKIKGIIK